MTKRQILAKLKRDELIAAVDRFELDVADKRRRDLLIDALGHSRKAPITEILGDLKRDRLKELCHAFGRPPPSFKLKSSEYLVPVLGLIFLRYADHKFAAAEAELAGQSTGRRQIGPADYQARGVLYLPPEARFSNLLRLPEGANVGQAINDAMRAIEAENPDLKDVLPKTYNRLEGATLAKLLKLMNSIAMDIGGDGARDHLREEGRLLGGSGDRGPVRGMMAPTEDALRKRQILEELKREELINAVVRFDLELAEKRLGRLLVEAVGVSCRPPIAESLGTRFMSRHVYGQSVATNQPYAKEKEQWTS